MSSIITFKEVQDIIKDNDRNKLKEFIRIKNIEFKTFDNGEFNILQYTHHLYKTRKISLDIKRLVFKNYDIKRKEFIDIVLSKDFEELKKYVKKHNIEIKQFDYPLLDIRKFISSLFDKGVISEEVKYFILINYDHKRREAINFILENNMKGLKEYVIKNNIELKNLNDKYFNITKYCNYYNKKEYNKIKENIINILNKKYDTSEIKKINKRNDLINYVKKNIDKFDGNHDIIKYSESIKNISIRMINLVIQLHDNQRYHIIELIKADKFEELENYIKDKNIVFHDLNSNDKYFDIIKFCKIDANKVSSKMLDFILENYTKDRKEVLQLIKKNEIERLHGYIKDHDIELEKMNDDNFNIVSFCDKKNYFSFEMRIFVTSHLNKKCSYIVELITEDRDEELEEYINKKHLDLKSLSNEYFDILEFCNCNNNCVSSSMKNLVKTYYDSKLIEVIKLVDEGDVDKLKKFIVKNNIELKKLENKKFKLIKYIKRNHKKIKKEMESFVIYHYTILRSNIVDLIEKGDLKELQDFIKNEKDFNLKCVNDENFDLLEYVKANKKIKPEIKEFIYKYYDKQQYIIKILNSVQYNDNDSEKLKEIMCYKNWFKYDFKFIELNSKNFDIVHFVILLFKEKKIPYGIKDYILTNFDHNISNIIMSMNENLPTEEKRIKLDGYFKECDTKFYDTYCNILEYNYTYTIGVPKELVQYMLSRFDQRKDYINKLITEKNSSVNELKKYIEKYFISLKDYNILKTNNLINRNITPEMIDFINTHYTYEQFVVMESIMNNDISKLKNYHEYYDDLTLITLYPKSFNLIGYCCNNKNVTFKTCNFVITHYDPNRYKIVEMLQNNNIHGLENIVQNNRNILKNLNDQYFNFVDFVLSLPNTEVKQYALLNYEPNLKNIINSMKNMKVDEMESNLHENSIGIHKLDNNCIRILRDFCSTTSDENISDDMKRLVLNHLDIQLKKIYSEILQFIKENKLSELKKYTEIHQIEFKDFDQEPFNIIGYCKNPLNNVSSEITNFIIHNYSEKRKTIIDLIKQGDIKKIKMYVIRRNMDIEEVNDDNFNIIEYCEYKDNAISSEMRLFIQTHINKTVYDIVELIDSGSISQLKKYLKRNNLELKSINNKYFNLLEYIHLPNSHIVPTMKEYIIKHYDKKRSKFVNIMEGNKDNFIPSIMEYLKNNNVELKDLNDEYFNIVKFAEKISEKAKNFVISHLYQKRYDVVEYAKNCDIDTLKLMVTSKSYIKELKEIDDDDFSIIDYCKDSKNGIKSKVRDFIISHYDEKISAAVEFINNNDYDGFNEYIKENDIECKIFINENFNIIEYLDKVQGLKNDDKMIFKQIIIDNYSKERKCFIDIIDNSSTNDKLFERLNEFFIKYDGIELKSLDDQYFDSLKYITENTFDLSTRQKNFIIYHYDHRIEIMVNSIKEKDRDTFKHYITESMIDELNRISSYFIKHFIKKAKTNENIKFVLDNGYKAKYIKKALNNLDKKAEKRKKRMLKLLYIYENNVFDNDMIVKLLSARKYKWSISNEELEILIKKENDKFLNSK